MDLAQELEDKILERIVLSQTKRTYDGSFILKIEQLNEEIGQLKSKIEEIYE